MDEYFTASVHENGLRLDSVLSMRYPEKSRSYFQKLIKDGNITVNENAIKPNYRLRENDKVQIIIPIAEETDIVAEDIPLDIIYEDEDIIVINKPKGMVVHPAPGHYSGTLVNALMYHCKNELSGINGILRPGIVHRIDRDTTGVMVACKNDMSHNSLAQQLKIHSITRRYEAIVYNNFADDDGIIDAPIGRHPAERKKMAINYKNGREAVTHYHVIKRLKGFTHIECRLETGRTHQIRVHMASINHPLLGDSVYGPAKCPYKLEGQTLHAAVLGFVHPRSNKYVEFTAPLPEYFNKLLVLLDK